MPNDEKRQIDEVLMGLASYQSRGAARLTAQKLSKLFRDESDRGLVIILVTHVEDRLLDRICRELPQGNKNRKALIKGGPLRTFEHRLAMARALGILRGGHLENLDVMRAMRNACAHSRQDISFATPQLRRALSLLFEDDDGFRDRVARSDRQDCRDYFGASISFMLTVISGLSHEKTRKTLLADLNSLMADENVTSEQLADRLLLGSLRRKPTSKRVLSSRRRAKG